MRDGHRLLICYGSVIVFCAEVDRRILGEAGPVNLGVVNGPAYGLAIETVEQLRWNGELAINKGRRLQMTLGEGVFLRDRESGERAHPRTIANHGADIFDLR